MKIIGGLPRTGSTLITNILNQDPDSSVSNTSPLPDLIAKFNEAFAANLGAKASLDYEETRRGYYRGLKGFVEGWGGGDGYVDKSRDWISMIPQMDILFGRNWRIVVPIRSLEGIVESCEQQSTKYPELATNLPIDPVARASHFMQAMFIAKPLTAIKQLHGAPKGTTLVVKYEDFTATPDAHMSAIGEFLGFSDYTYNTYDITQTLFEHDPIHLPFGDHSLVSGGVRSHTSPIVADGVSEFLRAEYSWYYDRFYT